MSESWRWLNRTAQATRFIEKPNGHLEARGIWYDLLPVSKIIPPCARRHDSPLNEDYDRDTSINAFLESEYGKELHSATQGAISDPKNILLEMAADGVTIFKFKHHITTVIVIRYRNVPPWRRGENSNIEIIALVPGPKEPHNTGIFLQDFCNDIKATQQPGGGGGGGS